MRQLHETIHSYPPSFAVALLPRNKVTHTQGMILDHEILFTPGGTIKPLNVPVNGRFAAKLLIRMAELVSDPTAIETLEARLLDKNLTHQARVLFAAMVNTARSKTQESKTHTP